MASNPEPLPKQYLLKDLEQLQVIADPLRLRLLELLSQKTAKVPVKLHFAQYVSHNKRFQGVLPPRHALARPFLANYRQTQRNFTRGSF